MWKFVGLSVLFGIFMLFMLNKKLKIPNKAEYMGAHQVIEQNDLSSHSLYMCVSHV